MGSIRAPWIIPLPNSQSCELILANSLTAAEFFGVLLIDVGNIRGAGGKYDDQ